MTQKKSKSHKGQKALKSHLTQADIEIGRKRIYLLIAMVVVSLIIAAIKMHT